MASGSFAVNLAFPEGGFDIEFDVWERSTASSIEIPVPLPNYTVSTRVMSSTSLKTIGKSTSPGRSC